MKLSLIIIVIFILTLGFCKDNKDNLNENPTEVNSPLPENTINPSEQNPVVYVTAKSGISLRKEANQNSEKLDLIPDKTKLNINSNMIPLAGIDNPSGWLEVEYKDKTGYVFSEFLSFIDPSKPILSKWNCSMLYNYNPGTETYSGEIVLFADNTYMTIGNTMEKFLEDIGTFAEMGEKISFTSQMGIHPNELYPVKEFLLSLEGKKHFEKNPQIIQKMKKSMYGDDPSSYDLEESKKIVFLVCKKQK